VDCENSKNGENPLYIQFYLSVSQAK